MKKAINQHLENVNDKQLVDALIKRGLITEEEMKFRLIPNEVIFKKCLHGNVEISNGCVFIRTDANLIDELERRTFLQNGKIQIEFVSDLSF